MTTAEEIVPTDETNTGAAVAAITHPLTGDEAAAEIRQLMGGDWLGSIYRERIVPLRTRAVQVRPAARHETVEPHHTLLGVELKIGRHRHHCPDLATARYLAVWSRAGCNEIALPYDITQISRLADEMESSWHRMLLLVSYIGAHRSAAFQSRVRSLLLAELQRDITCAGAGPAVPVFNQNTKQRAQRL